MDYAARLTEAIAAVCPITGVRATGAAVSDAFFPLPSATPSQLAAAQAVIDTFDRSDSAQTAWENLQQRSAADALLSDPQATLKALRAALLGLVDQINILRERDNDRAADVAAATSLADLKTRWAARSAFSDITPAQAKAFVQNKIDSGSAD